MGVDVTDLPAIELGTEPTALYRLYDRDGALLYIGITTDLTRRLEDHADEKSWWPQVTRKTAVLYGSRTEADAAETTAILAEKPRHNIAKTKEKKPPRKPSRDPRPPLITRLPKDPWPDIVFGPEWQKLIDDYAKEIGCGDRVKAMTNLLWDGLLKHYKLPDLEWYEANPGKTGLEDRPLTAIQIEDAARREEIAEMEARLAAAGIEVPAE